MAKCLVVNTQKFIENTIIKNLSAKGLPICNAIFLDDLEARDLFKFIEYNCVFIERFENSGLETNLDWQQIIFYYIIKREEEIYVYIRDNNDKKSTENRLTQRVSVGLGGHIYNTGPKFLRGLLSTLEREVNFIKSHKSVKLNKSCMDFIGIVKDDRDDVGKVHFGLIYLVTIDKDTGVELITNANFNGGFITYSKFLHSYVIDDKTQYKIEGWTQLILEKILPYI